MASPPLVAPARPPAGRLRSRPRRTQCRRTRTRLDATARPGRRRPSAGYGGVMVRSATRSACTPRWPAPARSRGEVAARAGSRRALRGRVAERARPRAATSSTTRSADVRAAPRRARWCSPTPRARCSCRRRGTSRRRCSCDVARHDRRRSAAAAASPWGDRDPALHEGVAASTATPTGRASPPSGSRRSTASPSAAPRAARSPTSAAATATRRSRSPRRSRRRTFDGIDMPRPSIDAARAHAARGRRRRPGVVRQSPPRAPTRASGTT